VKRPQSASLDLALQPKQEELYRLIEQKGLHVPTVLGYGGALGGGKSRAIRDIMLARRLQHAGTNGVIVRRVFDDVKKNHIDPLLAERPELRDWYRVSDHELLLPNGSRLLFMYAETTAEVERKFTGIEFFDIFVDQAEQFSEHELRTIKTRNRWPSASPGQCKTALFFNPGGCGTEFLRRVFYLKQYKTGERASDYAFIQAYGWDNWQWFAGVIGQNEFYELKSEQRFELFITETQYGRELNALPASLRAGHLLGSFESFAGQYFAGVWDESKCIITAIQAERLIQPWWTRWTATDWGFAHNAAHIWFATGKVGPAQFQEVFGRDVEYPVDVVIAYRELVVNQVEEQDLAQMMVDLTPPAERRLIKREFLSPDAFAKRGSSNTIAETFDDVFRRAGLPSPQPADNDRVGGWRLLYGGFKQTCSLLAENPVQNRSEHMLVVSAECPQIIAGMPLLTRNSKDAGKLEDVLKTDTIADDVGDAVRYGYKSMLDPRVKAPASVRALEVFEAAGSMTAKAMAMRQFTERERRTGSGTMIRPTRHR
jgi:terminase large subunit-like protein